jgi:DNA-binding MarR family transcriptional regulator
MKLGTLGDQEEDRPRALVNDLYGALAARGWGVVLPASLFASRPLGITTGQHRALQALLLHHRQPHEWVSVSLGTLATELGVKPQAVHAHLQRLVRRGLIARKPDERFSQKGNSPFYYSLEPYLAVLALFYAKVAEDQDARYASSLRAQAEDLFRRLEERVEDGWGWAPSSDSGSFGERRAVFLLYLGLDNA